jgi:hypothetical protein
MPRASAQSIIAATFGWDVRDVSDYRYQPTRTSRAIYAIGDSYFAVGKTPPGDDLGEPWEPHSDQFWATKAATVLWRADSMLQSQEKSFAP